MKTNLLLVVVIALCGACDPSISLLRLDALLFLRQPLVEECCSCLADTEIAIAGSDEGCGTADEGTSTPCLCELGRAQCEDALMNGDPITVVGACVEAVGPCADECDGTLAFP